MKFAPLGFAMLVLSGCASQLPSQDASSPMQVIAMAADAAPQPVRTSVDMTVRTVGVERDVTYLNSERDYRDQRSVSIEIPPAALANMEAAFGGKLAAQLDGKHIVVTGPARRVTVWFIDDAGKRTDKYYYQTHILVTAPAQIRVL